MSAKRDVRVYLQDIWDAIDRIERYTASGEREFLADAKTQDAVIRQMAIIGEAASKLSPGFKAKHPEIPWREAIGMRNILIHDYSETNINRVWQTVAKDLPPLKRVLQAILSTRAA
jgi:uncharacterized protein with HEPN domain